jgi:PAS domain S-box-containing protein
MTPEKEQYIETNLVYLLRYWVSFVTGAGAFVIMSLSFLDYLVTPSNFKIFLIYRVVAASAIFLLFLINKKVINKNVHHLFSIASAVIVTTMVALMIAKFGGHRSPYFAGIILGIIYIIAFTPLNVKISIIAGVIMYGIYLIPILVYDTISDMPFFINANVFILSTILSLLFVRYLMHQRFVNELSLQYDLEQQKQHLEILVAERTKELQISEQWHRSVFENATDGIVVLDKDGVIVNVNNRTCEMHGFTREELIGTSIWRLDAENDADLRQKRIDRILAGESLVFETTQMKKDGTPLPLEISSKAIPIAGELFIQSFYRDITEKKKFREYIAQSQKMESIGVLAGGIAHDFNNVLSAIMGHVEVVRMQTSLDARSLRSLQVIEDASRKAGSMISKLLGFARKSSFEVLPLYLNDVVHDTIKLLEQLFVKQVKLTVELDAQLPVMQGDYNQLEQIIMNLIVNARDAMPQGGQIHIRSQYRDIKEVMADVPSYIQAGEYILLSVSDTGCGIPDTVVQRIFEPFFTTKERGKGTGLGLSMVYGAVKEHRGYITVQSKLGAGTTFVVYFPVSRAAVSWAASKVDTVSRGNEMILFVDDEEEVLSAVRETLTTHGYKVLAASDPVLALDLFSRMPHEIALVITDMVMPKIDGKELIKRMRSINPGAKILAVSGYMKFVAQKEDIKEIAGFLQKPFESRHLLSMIRKILDARPNAHSSINV